MIKKRKRLLPEVRKNQLLNVAVKLAKKIGYASLTRDKVARLARVSDSLIAHYFSTRDGLKKAVMRYAIENEIIDIMIQGLSVNDTQLRRIKPTLKTKLMEHLKFK